MIVDLSPSIGLVSIILFLLPGLAGVKLGLQIAERGDWLNRIDTVALSFGVSIFSMLVLYFTLSIFTFGKWTEFITLPEIYNRLSTIPLAILHYLSLFAISLFTGMLLGCLDFGESYFTSNLLWRRFFDIAKDRGEDENYAVRIRTLAGDELFGRVEEEGETALSRDIILENPRRIRYTESGGISEEYRWTGYAYLHNQTISHIEFDRLEDADMAEVREAEQDEQQQLQESTEKDMEEMEELEHLAQEEENGETG